MIIKLDLSSGDTIAMSRCLKSAFRRCEKSVHIELFGPGMLIPDTALVLFEILRTRPSGLPLHVHTWSCLCDGSALLWLGADTRSMRSDTWIQIPMAPEADDQADSPATTDMRTIVSHMGEWLPVDELKGRRLFQAELKELGLLDDEESQSRLLEMFRGKP